MEAIAERARIAEKRQARRQAKLEAKAAKEAAERREETPAVETTASESGAMLDEHDWLVE